MGYPETVNDTVVYGEKNYYVDSDTFVGMLDGSTLDIWGNVTVNGKSIETDGSVNIKNFGAKGNGTTDDTVALQAAIDSVSNAVGTGISPIEIDLGVGTYRITNTIVLYRRAVILRGHGIGNASNYTPNPGRGTTIKWDGVAGIPMFNVRDSRHVVFKDMWLQGHDTNIPSEGIYFEQGSGDSVGTNEQLTCERVRFGFSWYLSGGYKMNYCVRFGGVNANNDQFTFQKCVFDRPELACVKIDSSQSIWGNFIDCFFEGNNIAKGIDSAATCTMINPQFNRCTVDVTVGVSAQVSIFGWHSESAKKMAVLNSAGRLVAHGGFIKTDSTVGGYMITAPVHCNHGCIDLDSVLQVPATPVTNAKIQVVGYAGAHPGYVSIRNCNIHPEQLEISSNAGGGKLNVIYNDRGINDIQSLAEAMTYVPPTAGTRMVGNLLRIVNTYSGTGLTAVMVDSGAYLRCTGTSPTYTVPLNSSVAFPIGTQIDGVGTATAMTIAAAGGVTINKARTLVTVGADSGWTLLKVGTDEWDLHGDFV